MSRGAVILGLGLLCSLNVDAQPSPNNCAYPSGPCKMGSLTDTGDAGISGNVTIGGALTANSVNGSFSIVAYGASGSNTGAQNCTAITNAITAAGVGGTVLFPYSATPYAVSGTCGLAPLNLQHWIGANVYSAAVTTATLNFVPSNNSQTLIEVSGLNGFDMENLSFVSNQENTFTNSVGIDVNNTPNVSMRNVRTDSFSHCIQWRNSDQFSTMVSVQAQNCVRDGVSFNNAQSIASYNGLFSNAQVNGNILINGGSKRIAFHGAFIDESAGAAQTASINISNATSVLLEGTEIFAGPGQPTLLIGDGTLDTDNITVNDFRIHPYSTAATKHIWIKAGATRVTLNEIVTDCGFEFFTTVPFAGCPTSADIQDDTGIAMIELFNRKQTGMGIISAGGMGTTILSNPTNGTFSTSSTGGTISGSTTRFYRVAGLDVNGDQTTASTETSIAIPAGTNTNVVNINWTEVGAVQYQIFEGATGAELLCTTVSGGTFNWTDQGTACAGAAPPSSNATGNFNLANTALLRLGGGTSLTNASGSNFAVNVTGQANVMTCSSAAGCSVNNTFTVGGGNNLAVTGTSGNQLACTGAATCNVAAASGQNLNLVTAGGGVVQVNGAPIDGSNDWTWSAYDPISTPGTLIAFAQMGAIQNASTIRSCTYTPTVTAVGTGTEVIVLCSGTGITSGHCTTPSANYCTCSITSASTQGVPVACTVNTSAIAAAINPAWVVASSSIATSDATGNIAVKFTSP